MDSSNGQLLSTVLTQAVHKCANEKLGRDRDKGWRRYNEWEQKKWKQQHYEYYEDELFRCCYAINKLPWSVGISTKALEAVSNVVAIDRLLLSSLACVCVGCGPGSDAIALLSRRHHRAAHLSPLVLFLVDRCEGWRPLLASLDEQLRERRLPYSLWFKAGCIRNALDAIRLLPDADMVVLSFAHSVNADPDLWPHLAGRYKLVIVIDITSETLADTLQRVGFDACQIESQSAVSIFYHLAAKGEEGVAASQTVSGDVPNDASEAAATCPSVSGDAPIDASEAAATCPSVSGDAPNDASEAAATSQSVSGDAPIDASEAAATSQSVSGDAPNDAS